MTIMEAGMLGIQFTLIRLVSSIPFIVLGSVLLERYFERINYKLPTIEK
jgi:hypothetical protein